MNGKNAFNVPMNVCRSLSALDPPMNFPFAFLLKFEANFALYSLTRGAFGSH
jgi:hypothetical protein